MKAKVRKQVQEHLEKAGKSKTANKLREEFKRKGFLSRREIRKLMDLMSNDTVAA